MAPTHKADPRHPLIDLATVRETLALIHADLGAAAHLEPLKAAIARALAEADLVSPRPSASGRPPCRARFVPWIANS